MQVQVVVNQTTDTSNPPVLDDIQLELGNIQVRFDGAGSIDYLIEFGVNVIPNLLRYQIMDALENPIKMRVQEVLNTVNVESIVQENLPKIDEYEKKGFSNLLL